MKNKILEFLGIKQDKKAEKNVVDLKLKIYVNKPERKDEKYNAPMIILTKKKAKKLKSELSKAISRSDDYVRINLTGELNPKEEKGKDYSFLAMEEMKAK